MNPVFYLLIILAAVLLWFLSSFVFYPLGKLAHRIWKEAMDEMNRKDEEKEKVKENER